MSKRLAAYELEAVAETIKDRIVEVKKKTPEWIEYERLSNLESQLEEEAAKEYKAFKEAMQKKYEKKGKGLKISDSYSGRLLFASPKKPDLPTVESIKKKLIIANLNGDINDVIESIVAEYTKTT